MNGQIFISYARVDGAFARKLGNDLRTAGIDVWWDVKIPPGVPWDVAVENTINASVGLIVIYSPSSVKSDEVLNEVSHAMGRGKRVLPVLHIKCDVPMRLSRLHYIDLTSDYASGLHQLIDTLTGAESSPGKTIRPPGKRALIPVIFAAALAVAMGLWIWQASSPDHNLRPRIDPKIRFDDPALANCGDFAPCLERRTRSALLVSTDWRGVRYDDKALLDDCMGYQLCIGRMQKATAIVSTDWTKARVGDPALADCMSFPPCVQRKNRSALLLSTAWKTVPYDDKALLGDCMMLQPCLDRAQRGQALVAKDWTKVLFDDPLLADCMSFPGCVQASAQAMKLTAIVDWRKVPANDPLRKNCMGLSRCLESVPEPPKVVAAFDCTAEAHLPRCCRDAKNQQACIDCKRKQGLLQNDYCGPN